MNLKFNCFHYKTGNLISLIILLKPATSNLDISRYSSERHKLQRSKFGSSFEYKLSSFYAYLTALSFCDFFSCIFAILNMLEYIPPPYMDINIIKYREFCLSISLYTHPVATTLQALSVWIICAFSIHRCRSIVKPSNFLSSIKLQKQTESNGETKNIFKILKKSLLKSFKCNKNDRNYFCHMNLKNNCNHQSYELKFYTKTLNTSSKFLKYFLFCFCTFSSEYNKPQDQPSVSSYELNNDKLSDETVVTETKIQVTSQTVHNHLSTKSKLRRVRVTIFILYLIALIYLIPQMFEKKLSYIEIQHKTYIFTTITHFGESRWFRQIFHLWFYMIAIYIFPFALILIFNALLLRAFFESKKRCKQYKLRTDPNIILRDYNSFASNIVNDEVSKLNPDVNIAELKETPHVGKRLTASIISDLPSGLSFNKASVRRRSSARPTLSKPSNRGRALTLTLFGVVAIFFICHFPAAIAKIIYVLFPQIEFEDKSALASIGLDVSNFLIMVNSSINFLLYIVFGPGKFRQEFSLIFFKVFSCCSKYCLNGKRDDDLNLNLNYMHQRYSFAEPKSKKCSITNSEYVFNNFSNCHSQNFKNSVFENSQNEISSMIKQTQKVLTEEENV